MLEQTRGKHYVHKLVRDVAGMDITFSEYPETEEFFEKLRSKVHQELEEIYSVS